MRQRTLARSVSYTGVAIHSGSHNTVTLRPAPDDTGVRFQRVDLEGQPVISAQVESVSQCERCTVLGSVGAHVSTVEHLLAALRGMEIDNVLVEIDGPEVPIADGSAREYVALIDSAGIQEQDRPRRVMAVERPLWVRVGGGVAVALPYDGFKVSLTFTNDHGHPVLGDLFAEFDVNPESFRREIAPARTIGWIEEVEALRARGLALGATMEMAVVISKDEILTPMRFPNEPVRHKILDIVGDVALAGFVHAHVVAVRSRHALNTDLARLIYSECRERAEMS